MVNPMIRLFTNGVTVRGDWSHLGSGSGVEIMTSNPEVVYLNIDMQHGPANDVKNVLDQARAAWSTAALLGKNIAVSVRPRGILREDLCLLLEGGIQSFVFPDIHTSELANRAVREVMYPPFGDRSVSGIHFSNGCGRDQEYFDKANLEMFVAVQIESPQAVSNVEVIAAVRGVQMLFVGPKDLGRRKRTDHDTTDPDITEDLMRIVAAAKGRNKLAGILDVNPANFPIYVNMGFDLVVTGVDSTLLNNAVTGNIAAIQAALT